MCGVYILIMGVGRGQVRLPEQRHKALHPTPYPLPPTHYPLHPSQVRLPEQRHKVTQAVLRAYSQLEELPCVRFQLQVPNIADSGDSEINVCA